jgi:hypothetical protein
MSHLEMRAAEATASAQAFKAEATEARAAAETAVAEAAEAIEKARSEAEAAVEEARSAAVDAVRRKTGSEPEGLLSGPAPDGGGQDVAELNAEVEHLQEQLDQMSERLRHAYAQTESAQALVTAARQHGQLPSETPEELELRNEVERLRAQLASTMTKMHDAQERAARFEADLTAMRHGVELDGDRPSRQGPPDEPSMHDPSGASDEPDADPDDQPVAEPSLRSRLARTAARKRQRGGDDEGAFYG